MILYQWYYIFQCLIPHYHLFSAYGAAAVKSSKGLSLPCQGTSTVTIEQWALIATGNKGIACLRWVDSGSLGRWWGQATIILTKWEALLKLASKSAFCAHETQYLQKKLSESQQLHQPVQKKGKWNKKSMKLRFVLNIIKMHFLKCLKLIILFSNIF
jgi:hypothetical protein